MDFTYYLILGKECRNTPFLAPDSAKSHDYKGITHV